MLRGVDAVAQAVLTNLKLFYGEWFENVQLGLPVFQDILGQLGSARGIESMTQLIRSNILSNPYVTGITDVTVDFASGKLSFTATFTTIFGPATVDSVLGQQASLE
jgi:hypothetical protein